MEESLLKLASTLGGFAGVTCVGIIYYIGRRLLELEDAHRTLQKELTEAWDRHTRMELIRLIASPHVTVDVKNQLETQLQEVVEAQKKREKRQ